MPSGVGDAKHWCCSVVVVEGCSAVAPTDASSTIAAVVI